MGLSRLVIPLLTAATHLFLFIYLFLQGRLYCEIVQNISVACTGGICQSMSGLRYLPPPPRGYVYDTQINT